MSDNKKISQHWCAILMGCIVAIVFLFTLVTFQVSETDYAIVTRFGKPNGKTYNPGLHWKLPYPWEKVWHHDKRIQCFEGIKGKWEEIQTADGKNIVISLYVGWKLSNPQLYFERINNTKTAELEINAIIRNAKNSVIGKYPLKDLINSEEKQLKIREIENEMLKQTQAQARKLYGIDIVFLGINHLGFPQKVADAVFKRMKEERNRLAKLYTSEGESKATSIKAKADAEAKMIIADANAKAQGIRAEGDMKAAQYYSVFEKNIQLALFLRKLDSLKKTLNNKTTLILDTNTPPYDLLSKDAIKINTENSKKK